MIAHTGIACLGDSLTAGWQLGDAGYAPYTAGDGACLIKDSFPAVLGRLVAGDARAVTNLGRSGSTTADWLPGGHWCKRDKPCFPLNGHPLDDFLAHPEGVHTCLVLLGTNDVCALPVPSRVGRLLGENLPRETGMEPAARNLQTIVESLLTANMRVFLATIPFVAYPGGFMWGGLDRLFYATPAAQRLLFEAVRNLNRHIRKITDLSGVLAGPDFGQLFAARPGLLGEDLVHLNAAGYAFMAQSWAELLGAHGLLRIPD